MLSAAGVPREAFLQGRGEAEGARRPYRVPIVDVVLRNVDEAALEVSFPLPPGSYATRVLAELTKSDVAVPES